MLLLAVSAGRGQTITKPELFDTFGRISNDELQAHVQYFQQELAKDGSTGLAVLYGPPLLQYFSQRRIMGCNLFLKESLERIQFKFDKNDHELKVEFWKIPAGFKSADLAPNVPDYKLNLTTPVEMTSSMASDDFCPRYFQLNWYAKFLIANPALTGRAVIDVRTKKDFIDLVLRYRKELLAYGVAAGRLRYYHKHFNGEHDEQFWLIPPSNN